MVAPDPEPVLSPALRAGTGGGKAGGKPRLRSGSSGGEQSGDQRGSGGNGGSGSSRKDGIGSGSKASGHAGGDIGSGIRPGKAAGAQQRAKGGGGGRRLQATDTSAGAARRPACSDRLQRLRLQDAVRRRSLQQALVPVDELPVTANSRQPGIQRMRRQMLAAEDARPDTTAGAGSDSRSDSRHQAGSAGASDRSGRAVRDPLEGGRTAGGRRMVGSRDRESRQVLADGRLTSGAAKAADRDQASSGHAAIAGAKAGSGNGGSSVGGGGAQPKQQKLKAGLNRCCQTASRLHSLRVLPDEFCGCDPGGRSSRCRARPPKSNSHS